MPLVTRYGGGGRWGRTHAPIISLVKCGHAVQGRNSVLGLGHQVRRLIATAFI